ncbi:MAG: hypothetical protein DIU65_09035 [Proteobacteria bacterium]|jgi:hypothetical protein|nr:MAG: hypothetical protein DIU65_09035 [Pseudomonadota bacterium]
MKCDALFQLGMGPAQLDATQTEDNSSLWPMRAPKAGFRMCNAGKLFSARVLTPGFGLRLRGNSAKALIGSA